MSVLVLGGSYFIGRTLVGQLIEAGHTVSVLNRGTRPVDGPEQIVADRNDADAFRRAVAGRSFDRVFDMSCYTARQAAIALSELKSRTERWLYLSTAAVYKGGSQHRWTEHEVGPGREWEDYGRNKLAAEHELERQTGAALTPVIVLRAPYVYGPGNSLPREAWLWSRMLQGKPIWMPGTGTTHLQFVHALDLTSAAIQCLRQAQPGLSAFNVAHPRTPTIREYLDVLGEVAGVRPQIREVPYERLGLEPRRFFPFRDYPCLLDTTRITQALDWRPRFDLREGLEHTFRSLDRPTLLQSDVDVESEQRLLELG